MNDDERFPVPFGDPEAETRQEGKAIVLIILATAVGGGLYLLVWYLLGGRPT